MKNNNWSREELLLAFNLYCKIPFGQYHQHNAEVIRLAEAIRRTPSAVAMKLGNFASLDSYHQTRGIKGLGNASKADKEIWDEFSNDWNKLGIESEYLSEQVTPQQTELVDQEAVPAILETWEDDPLKSTEKSRSVRIRLGQSFFRKTTLANYKSICCICGMPIKSLLVASHIIPWREREDLRLNPHNGLCLCAIHDKGFDKGLLTLDENYHVILSPTIQNYLPNDAITQYFEVYQRKSIAMPFKFLPDPRFLAIHREDYFAHD